MEPEGNNYTDPKSPPKCPSCGSNAVVPIIYGLPGPELMEDAKSGKIEIGGCIVMSSNPTRKCKSCGHSWRSSQETADRDE